MTAPETTTKTKKRTAQTVATPDIYKQQPEKPYYTEQELELIRTSQAVMAALDRLEQKGELLLP